MSDDSRRVPDFDDLVGRDGLSPDEAERLERVHDLLVLAGPPPELSPRAVPPREREANVFPLFPRRRKAATVVIAAAVALAMFGAGYLVGGRSESVEPETVIAMAAPSGSGSAARASLALFPLDDAGNWPMELTVSGLPALPEGQTYELWLTHDESLAEPCGVFSVAREGTTVVPLNAPYKLRQFDEWVVVRTGTQQPILLTT